jgi:hypothetical protein
MATTRVQPVLFRVSWGALLAGFFFGFGAWLLLLALGAGIGLASFDPRDLGGWQSLGIGFGIWGAFAGFAAMFAAGWLTARLSASDEKLAGVLHGATLWGFMLVAGLWIATMAVGRTTAAAAQAVGGAASAVSAAAEPTEVREEAQQTVAGAAEQVQETAGTAGAWAFFLFGLLTLAAAVLGGRAGVPRGRHVVVREETAPAPGAPLSPRRV